MRPRATDYLLEGLPIFLKKAKYMAFLICNFLTFKLLVASSEGFFKCCEPNRI